MARKKGDFISGVLGPLVFRVVNGVQIIGSKTPPGKMKQTAETKRAANTFGMGSSLGAIIRKTLQEQLLGISDSGTRNRLNGKLTQILGNCRDPKSRLYQFKTDSFSGLKDFEFNAKSPVDRFLTQPPAVVLEKGILKVSLPEMEIPGQLKFPHKSFQCRINVSISLFRLREGLYKFIPETQSLIANKNMTSIGPYEFEFVVPDGCLCVVSLFLLYETADHRGWKAVNNPKFNPGYICEAFVTDGEYQGNDQNTWRDMIKFP